jgi:hypothetical protein
MTTHNTYAIPLAAMAAALLTSCGGGTSMASASGMADEAETQDSQDASGAGSASEETSSDTSDTADTLTSESDTSMEGTGSETGEVDEPVGTNVMLHVVSTALEPLALATVTVDGVRYSTNSEGYLHFDNLDIPTLDAKIEAEGHAPARIALVLVEDGSLLHEVELIPLAPPILFEAEQGAAIEQDGVRLEINPNLVVDALGNKASGVIEATITVLDPYADEALDDAPGPFLATSADDVEGYLAAVSMIDISLWQDGEPMSLAPGAFARIEVDIPAELQDALTLDQELPAWWLDLDAGRWREDGIGRIEAGDEGLIWAANLEHFSWWSMGVIRLATPHMGCMVIELHDKYGNVMPNVNFSTLLKGSMASQLFFPGVFKDTGVSQPANVKSAANCVHAPLDSVGSLRASINGLKEFTPLAGPSVVGSCTDIEACEVRVVDLFVDSPVDVCPLNTTQNCAPPQGTDPGLLTNGQFTHLPCRVGARVCLGYTWTSCIGQVTPALQESCKTFYDDDCDGVSQSNVAEAMEAGDCECIMDQVGEECYAGPPGTKGVGQCKVGQYLCLYDNTAEQWEWDVASCNSIPPEPIACNNETLLSGDQDCNGVVGCSGATNFQATHGPAATPMMANDVLVREVGEPLETKGLYVTGSVSGAYTFNGGATDPIQGGSDLFVMKYAVEGADVVMPDWSRNFGSAGTDQGHALASTGDGSLFVAGMRAGDVLVMKLDGNGNEWSDQIFSVVGSSPTDTAYDIAPYGAQDIVIVGQCADCMALGEPLGGSDGFVTILDANLKPKASVLLGSALADGLRGVFVSGDDVYVVGSFNDSADVGLPNPLISAGSNDIMVAKLTPNFGTQTFTTQWAKRRGGIGADRGYAIAGGLAGDLYITGDYRGAEIVDNGVTPIEPAIGQTDVFIMRYGLDGSAGVSRGFGGASFDQGLDVAVDTSGVVVVGNFVGTANFGGLDRNSVGGSTDMVIFRLSTTDLDIDMQPDLAHLWDRVVGDANGDNANGVFARDAQVYIVGDFIGGVDFGLGPAVNAASIDMFLTRWSN